MIPAANIERQISDRSCATRRSRKLYTDRATKTWLYSSVFWIVILALLGLTMVSELVTPNVFAGIPELQFGRIRPMRVNGAIFAWLTMMYYGGAFHVLPGLLRLREMWSESLAVALGWVWNIAFAAGVVTLALGYTQGANIRRSSGLSTW